MPKGGPLAFLNKKTWHPGRIQNQEKVWLKEQEAAKEQQKLEDLKKQIEEERAREELDALAQAAGVKKREEKLDWMYQGGVGAKLDANQRTDNDDTGRDRNGVENARADESVLAGGGGRTLPSFYEKDDPSSANEIWQRLHGDPLMIMKQQELQARRSIVSNPIKMDAIKKRVDERHEEERRRRKEKRHRHHHREDRMERYDTEHKKGDSRHRRSSEDDRKEKRRKSRSRDDVGKRDQERSSRGYGISFSTAAPESIRHKDRSNAIEENRRRLEEAARRRDEEEKAGREKHRRRAHRAGSLTEDEKQRRLDEMRDSAKHIESLRSKRVSEYDSQVTREDSEYRSEHRHSSRDFLAQEARSRLLHRQ